MPKGRPQIFTHDIRLKVPEDLHRKVTAAAAKVRRPLPDFMRLVLEDAVAEPLATAFQVPSELLKGKLPGWTKKLK